MSNQVDTTDEAINREWEAIEEEFGMLPTALQKPEPQTEPTPEKAPEPIRPKQPETDSDGLFNNMDGVDVEDDRKAPETSMPSMELLEDEQIAMAKVVIAGGLSFVVTVGMGLDASAMSDKIQKVAESYAVVITKYYRGGIFEFLAKFKEEIAAVGATLAFLAAVKAAKSAKQLAVQGESE